MSTTLPADELRNYGEVLREVTPGSPVFLTRNGRGRYAVVDIEDWELREPARELVAELDLGRVSAASGTRTLADVRDHLARLMSDDYGE